MKNNTDIIGRSKEIQLLEKLAKEKKASLVVTYGRRRIGKSFLINSYLKDKINFSFEGVEQQSSLYQIHLIVEKLNEQVRGKFDINRNYNSWNGVLELLTLFIKDNQKTTPIVFLDEYQWLTAGRSRLTSLLKKYWDNDWKDQKIQLILCGSVSSYMIGKVIKSKALYGRISSQLNIEQLRPQESTYFFKNKISQLDILKYLIIFGGVPKYLSEINQKLSFEQNIADLLFNKNSVYLDEYEKIFYSQFKEHQIYEQIVKLISEEPMNLAKIAIKIKKKSGGGLASYLKNLERAQFIKGYYSSADNRSGKLITYKLIDPFLKFYFQFIYKNKELIISSRNPLETFRKITKDKFSNFMGIAFENLCNFFALDLAEIMGFSQKVISWGPFLGTKKANFQIDLIYFMQQGDIAICEIKYSKELINTSIIAEMETKVGKIKELYPHSTIHKVLITTIGVVKPLEISDYFDHVLTAKEIFKR